MERFFITTFWMTLVLLWIALALLYLILTNKRSLQKRGYPEQYIAYLRKSHLIRICCIAVLLPLILLVSAWFVRKITGELTEEVQMAYIVVVLFILVIPLKYLDEKINQRWIKRLAIDTGEKVVIDLNYRTLHLIFNPWLEALLGISGLLCGILVLKIEQWVVYLFLITPWLMYFTIRGVRYQVLPYLKDNYKYLFAFNMFSFLFFFVYFLSYLIVRLQDYLDESAEGVNIVDAADKMLQGMYLTIGFIIAIGLAGRMALYLSNYKRFNAEIGDREWKDKHAGRRKVMFFIASVFIIMIMTSIGLTTDILKSSRTQVGRVVEKYIIDVDDDTPDTLAIIGKHGIIYSNRNADYISGTAPTDTSEVGQFLQSNKDKNLKLYCRIEECRSKNLKSYEVCCEEAFTNLPVESMVKYEYSSHNRITRLILE
jgi:hypothetical protein